MAQNGDNDESQRQQWADPHPNNVLPNLFLCLHWSDLLTWVLQVDESDKSPDQKVFADETTTQDRAKYEPNSDRVVDVPDEADSDNVVSVHLTCRQDCYRQHQWNAPGN